VRGHIAVATPHERVRQPLQLTPHDTHTLSVLNPAGGQEQAEKGAGRGGACGVEGRPGAAARSTGGGTAGGSRGQEGLWQVRVRVGVRVRGLRTGS
jgi:hypothetical protein